MYERTIEETKDLIAVAIEVRRQYQDGRAVDVASRVDFQRGRSERTDFLDWACWFLKYGDKLPIYLHRPWLAYIGEIPWYRHYGRKAERAVDVFSTLVPEELWEQGRKIVV